MLIKTNLKLYSFHLRHICNQAPLFIYCYQHNGTALLMSAHNGHVDIVKLLLDTSAAGDGITKVDSNLKKINSYPCQILLYAPFGGCSERYLAFPSSPSLSCTYNILSDCCCNKQYSLYYLSLYHLCLYHLCLRHLCLSHSCLSYTNLSHRYKLVELDGLSVKSSVQSRIQLDRIDKSQDLSLHRQLLSNFDVTSPYLTPYYFLR